jgi:predicted Holliday junction resolvase-like endonuclease
MVVIVLILLAVVAIMSWKINRASKKNDEISRDASAVSRNYESVTASYAEIVVELKSVQEKLSKTVSQKKSSEVKTGLIVEQMAPFLDGFPYEPGKANFLAKPIDFVVFDDEGVHFVEVKSGGAQLSSKQRKIRDLISDNKVTFEVYRIKGN